MKDDTIWTICPEMEMNMREIDNNSHSNINFQGIQPAQKLNENPVPETETPVEKGLNKTDLRNMPADVIGRSQVSQTGLEKDLAFLGKNYGKVEQADRYMQYLMNQGMDYEHAAELATEFAREFAQE